MELIKKCLKLFSTLVRKEAGIGRQRRTERLAGQAFAIQQKQKEK